MKKEVTLILEKKCGVALTWFSRTLNLQPVAASMLIKQTNKHACIKIEICTMIKLVHFNFENVVLTYN